MLALVCIGFGACATLLSIWLWSLLTRRPEAPAQREIRSRGQWLWRWLVRPVAQRLAPFIPPGWQPGIHRALERAGLDHIVTVAEWVAIVTLTAAGMSGSCLLLSDAVAFDLALRIVLAALCGCMLPCIWLRDRILKQKNAVLRELPGYLDLLTLGLEAGCAFGAALQIAVNRSAPSSLRAALQLALQEMRAGRGRADALKRLERRMGVAALSAAIAAITQAEATGVSLAPVMRAQALRGTQERFARAEKLAMEAPVKMLAPLVLCIFPCTFIVVGFPIAVRLLWGM